MTPCPMCVAWREDNNYVPKGPWDEYPADAGPMGLCGGHALEVARLLQQLVKERGLETT